MGSNRGASTAEPAIRTLTKREIDRRIDIAVRLPLDEKGADVLVVTPSADFFAEPHVDGLIGYGKVFHEAGANWTLSSKASEAGNFGMFIGSYENMRRVSLRIREAALELIHQMAAGEGFGSIVGQGVRRMKKIFSEKFGANAAVLQDIGMESKGLEFSEYMTKESLAQQGGYGMALKGPQHDEAWLIFLDMVHNFMPSFEQKAEALHWFPMFRTWFGLCGLCKLPWNDIVTEDNKDTEEPAKVIKHVQWYAEYFSAVTGRQVQPDDLIQMSERVYNFQRIFNLRMGFGTREHESFP